MSKKILNQEEKNKCLLHACLHDNLNDIDNFIKEGANVNALIGGDAKFIADQMVENMYMSINDSQKIDKKAIKVIKTIEHLQQYNLNMDSRSVSGVNLLMRSLISPRLTRYLLEKNPEKINDVDNFNSSLLHFLVAINHSSVMETARVLLDFGIDIHIKNNDGLTAIDTCIHENSDIKNMLIAIKVEQERSQLKNSMSETDRANQHKIKRM